MRRTSLNFSIITLPPYSNEFCQCKFDESKIRIRLGGGNDHLWIIFRV